MLTQRLANIIFASMVILACIWFGWMAQGFETSGLLASSGLPSKFFPQLTLGFMFVCAVIVAAQYVLNGYAGGDDRQFVFETGGHAARGLLMLAVAVLSYFIWTRFGFIAMACVMAPASLLAMGVRSPLIYAVMIGLTGIIFLVFTRLLGVQLV